jgi:hypothetical protein
MTIHIQKFINKIKGAEVRGQRDISISLTGVLCSPDVGGVDETNLPEIQEVHANGEVGTPAVVLTIALSGVEASGAVGTITHGGAEVALSGVEAAGLVGTMIYNESDETSGDVAFGEVGTVEPVISVALTSVTAAGLVNTVTFAQVGFLTTDSAAGLVGTIGPVVTVALSGVQAVGSVGSVIAIYWRLVDDSETSNWQNVNNSQTAGWTLVNNAETPDWTLVETD